MGDEREFMLNLIHEQSDELGGKIDALKHDTDGRLMALEKRALEDERMRLDVRDLTTSVRTLIESDRQQNTSLTALTAALKPSVEATASVEGGAAGAHAGKISGRIWGLVGSALALVLAGALQQCQQQIERGAFSPVPSASK